MEIKATRYYSGEPITPFAPFWDYTIAICKLDIDLASMKELILKKEKEIIEEYTKDKFPLVDGGTGLGLDSLTSRFKYFNLLTWDHPACKQLHESIRSLHLKYHWELLKMDPPDLKIRCWANVLRKGERIKKHVHAIHPGSYLSGHFCVSTIDSSTKYVPPYKTDNVDIEIENVSGEMTLFPTCLPHYTTVTKSDEPRITIAFDIIPIQGVTPYDNENLIIL